MRLAAILLSLLTLTIQADETEQPRLMAPVTQPFALPGTVIAKNVSELSVEASGVLVNVLEVGAFVEQGQEIARIDTELMESELALAKVRRQTTQRKLSYLQGELARLRSLNRHQHISEQSREKIQYEVDKTSLELAEQEHRLQQLQTKIARGTLRAPFTGVVSERLAQRGQWVNPQRPVVLLLQHDALQVQVTVPKALKNDVRSAQIVLVDGDIRSPVSINAVVPALEPRTQNFEMRLRPLSGNWWHGQQLKVEIMLPGRFEISSKAIIQDQGQSYVRVIDNSATPRRVSVVMHELQGATAIISGHISQDDRIVIGS